MRINPNWCPRCKVVKRVCDGCRAEYNRRWRANHPTYGKEAGRRWRAEHPEYQREYWARRQEEHAGPPPEAESKEERNRRADKEMREEYRRWWMRTRKTRLAYGREYWKRREAEHPEITAERNARKRATLLKVTVPGTEKAVREFYKWAKNTPMVECRLCGKRLRKKGWARHVDHIMPLSRGGLHVVENLAVLCPTCNLHKSAKLPSEVGLVF